MVGVVAVVGFNRSDDFCVCVCVCFVFDCLFPVVFSSGYVGFFIGF